MYKNNSLFSSKFKGFSTRLLSCNSAGKAKAIRFSTLESICKALECQPADILEYNETE